MKFFIRVLVVGFFVILLLLTVGLFTNQVFPAGHSALNLISPANADGYHYQWYRFERWGSWQQEYRRWGRWCSYCNYTYNFRRYSCCPRCGGDCARFRYR